MFLGASIGLDYASYTALGYIVSIIFSFFMNFYYTFQVTGDTYKRLLLFFMINTSNLLLVEGIEYFLIEICSFKHILAILCGMFWYSMTGFLMNRAMVYR